MMGPSVGSESRSFTRSGVMSRILDTVGLRRPDWPARISRTGLAPVLLPRRLLGLAFVACLLAIAVVLVADQALRARRGEPLRQPRYMSGRYARHRRHVGQTRALSE